VQPTLIIESKYFCYVGHQIRRPERLKKTFYFRQNKIFYSLIKSRALNLEKYNRQQKD